MTDSNTTTTTTVITNVMSVAISGSEKQFKNSSTAFLAIILVLLVGYTVAKFIKNKKTNFGMDVSLNYEN
jgi:flagellar biogenesis protein FliO